MQKSKTATIVFIAIIAVYMVIRELYLEKLGTIYTYVINPLFWIIYGIILLKILDKNYENKKLKKEIIEYTLIACLIYVIVYMISGLFVTFGNNPYSRSLKGIITNLWIMGTVIVAKEYIRYKLINNVYNKEKKEITIIVTILFTLVDFEIIRKFGGRELSTYYVFTEIFKYFIPMLARNTLYSYLAFNNNFTSAVTYELITNLFLWLSPILPNVPWIMYSIIDTAIPLILLLYIRYTKNKLDKFKSREKILNSDPKSIIPLVVLVILAIWFALGIFPIKPVSIASGSMEDELNIGDVVIIKRCSAEDVNVGDIIEYQMNDFTIIHRVVEKHQTKGEYYFRTKGDNNAQPDMKMVEEYQLIGKVVFKVRYIGYPSILMNLFKEQRDLEVNN